jgi:hypothetical protein
MIAERVVTGLREINRLRELGLKDESLKPRLAMLRHWQSERLRQTHADLLVSSRYGKAARFFLDDIYGPQDFSQRDADLVRIVPAIERLLPQQAIRTIAHAVELNLLTELLDHDVAQRLPQTLQALTPEQYCLAYAVGEKKNERSRQIDLVELTGRELDKLVRLPFMGSALRMMRKPAAVAGLSTLQQFLERGFEAFHSMKGAEDFLRLVSQRERDLMLFMYDQPR